MSFSAFLDVCKKYKEILDKEVFTWCTINPSTCFAMKNTWKHGIAQVRLYDPYAPGDVSRYLSKGRFSSAADCEGANTYELRKFNRADWIYISPGVWAEMREARTVARRMSPLLS